MRTDIQKLKYVQLKVLVKTYHPDEQNEKVAASDFMPIKN